MSRRAWAWAQFVASGLTLGVLVWRLGTTPFLNGLRSVDAGALAAAAGLIALSTVCCAWRWKLVAGGLGVELSLPAAVAAYYRALFLNVALPGGVLGDVHRGISHGREVSNVGRAMRAVLWERLAGQVVQVGLTVVVLLLLPSPVRSSMPLVVLGLVVVSVAAILLTRLRTRPGPNPSVWARVRSAVAGDIRNVLGRRAWLGIGVASVIVVCGYALTFLIAASTAGAIAPFSRMLPLALLAIVAMVVPSIGGWGPREGVTAWAFSAAGLGAGRGVQTAVVYGLMVLVATLPGAVVLAVSWSRRNRAPRPSERPLADGVVRV